MTSYRAQEILYESEAALRLVDNELSRLRSNDQSELVSTDDESDFPQLVQTASEQLQAVIERIRETRTSSNKRSRVHTAADSTEQALADIEERLVAVTRLFENSLAASRHEGRARA